MYLFACALRSEVLLHSQSQTKSVDRSMADSTAFIYRVNSACFVQVNRLLLSKTYKKNFGGTNFWSGRNDFELGRNDFELGRNDFELGRNDF